MQSPHGTARREAVDFSDFVNESFSAYKLKDECRDELARMLVRDRYDELLATIEYMASRLMEQAKRRIEDEIPNEDTQRTSFFDHEFDKRYLRPGFKTEASCLEDLVDLSIKGESKEKPILCDSFNGNTNKVSLVLSLDCFEPDSRFTCKATCH